VIAQQGQLFMDPFAPWYRDDMNKFKLRHPGRREHFMSSNNLVHASNPCAGEHATPLNWVTLAALWEHGQDQSTKRLPRNIGWCENCCVDPKPQLAVV
jgi:hypothetical protein